MAFDRQRYFLAGLVLNSDFIAALVSAHILNLLHLFGHFGSEGEGVHHHRVIDFADHDGMAIDVDNFGFQPDGLRLYGLRCDRACRIHLRARGRRGGETGEERETGGEAQGGDETLIHRVKSSASGGT